MTKTIHYITASNLEKDNKILTVFGINISDITGHQMAVQIPSSPDVCCCTTWGNRTNATWDKNRKKNISKFNHSKYVALNSPDHSPFDSICNAMQQRVYGTLLKKIVNSRSNWLKSEAEHYQHRYQRMENASLCLCLHKWPIIQIFTVSSCTTEKLDKLSTKKC